MTTTASETCLRKQFGADVVGIRTVEQRIKSKEIRFVLHVVIRFEVGSGSVRRRALLERDAMPVDVIVAQLESP